MLFEQPPLNESWEAAVEGLRAEIAGYYPGWTDHNVHDPGITILEMFAGLAQAQCYHAGQIGPAHQNKYRKLLGLPRGLRKPGHTLVTVDAAPGVFLSAGTRFYADHICFEMRQDQMVEEHLFLAFHTDAGGTRQTLSGDWIAKGKGISLYPFGQNPKTGDCLVIELARPLAAGQPYRLSLETFKDYPVQRYPVDESRFEPYGFYPLAGIRLEYLAAGGFTVADISSDNTYGLLQDGSICFSLPLPMAGPAWELRLVLERNDYLVAPRLQRISMAMVEVWQQETCLDCAVWQGSGLPGQRYELPDSRILTDQMELAVEGQRWIQVEDFEQSQPEDCHYHLEAGVLQFGDGFRGKMPAGQIRIRKLVKSLGAMANIKAGTITRMAAENPLPAVNEWDVTGGCDEETAAETIKRYVETEETLMRAVTCSDYEYLIRTMPGLLIEDCKVYCELPEKKEIRLAVKPYAESGHGLLNEAYKKNIYRYLEDKRMIGTRLMVISPAYYGLEVVCIVESKVQYRDAGARIEAEITAWIKAKRFGEGICYGALKGMISTLSCVRRVESLWLDAGVHGKRNSAGDLLLPPNGLFWIKRVVCNLMEA